MSARRGRHGRSRWWADQRSSRPLPLVCWSQGGRGRLGHSHPRCTTSSWRLRHGRSRDESRPVDDTPGQPTGPDRPGPKAVGRPAVGGAGRPASTPPKPIPTDAPPRTLRCCGPGCYRLVIPPLWGNAPACPAVTRTGGAPPIALRPADRLVAEPAPETRTPVVPLTSACLGVRQAATGRGGAGAAGVVGLCPSSGSARPSWCHHTRQRRRSSRSLAFSGCQYRRSVAPGGEAARWERPWQDSVAGTPSWATGRPGQQTRRVSWPTAGWCGREPSRHGWPPRCFASSPCGPWPSA